MSIRLTILPRDKLPQQPKRKHRPKRNRPLETTWREVRCGAPFSRSTAAHLFLGALRRTFFSVHGATVCFKYDGDEQLHSPQQDCDSLGDRWRTNGRLIPRLGQEAEN